MQTLPTPIAHGRTADIHPWKDGWVLKVFHEWFERENIEYEARIGRAVHAAGIPAPAVGDMVEIDGKLALEYEFIPGEPMWVLLEKHPTRVPRYARLLAELHAQMHAQPVQADIPNLHAKLKWRIANAPTLPDNIKQAALSVLETLPEGNSLCHGDFHPANILINGDQSTIIDWIDSSIGNPLADVARTSILALGAAATDPSKIGGLGIRIMHALYLRRYFQLRPGGMHEYKKWLPIMAAARTDEGITELNPWLMKQAEVLLIK